MPPDQALRYTLECRGLPWRISRVEEQTSLARPPSMIVEAFTDHHGLWTEIERASASLLIEGKEVSRVVRGWIRYVEHLGIVGTQAQLCLHLIPIHELDVRSIDGSSQSPRPRPIPATAPSAEHTAPLTADELRKLRGAGRAVVKTERTSNLERTQRIDTELGDRPPAGSDAPSARPAAPAPHCTTRLTWQELQALHPEPVVTSAPPERSKPGRSANEETRHVTPEELAALRELRNSRPRKQ